MEEKATRLKCRTHQCHGKPLLDRSYLHHKHHIYNHPKTPFSTLGLLVKLKVSRSRPHRLKNPCRSDPRQRVGAACPAQRRNWRQISAPLGRCLRQLRPGKRRKRDRPGNTAKNLYRSLHYFMYRDDYVGMIRDA